MLLKLNAFNITGTSGWTGIKLNTTGVIASSIIDRNTGLTTNIDASYTGDLWTPASSGALTDQDHHGIEQNVWDNYNQITLAGNGTLRLTGFDISVGSQWIIGFVAAVANTPARNTAITVNGVSAEYVNIPQSVPMTPAPPVYVVATAVDDGTGRGAFDMTFAGTSFQKYITAITLSDSPIINSVNGDDAVKIGQEITWDVSLLTPTSATIDGITLTSVTATGGTMPNLHDNVACPDYGYRELTLSDGVESVSRFVYVYPADGYGYTRIRDISKTDPGYLKNYIPGLELDAVVTFKNGDQFAPPVLINTVDYDGRIATDHIGMQEIYVRNPSDGISRLVIIDTSGGSSLSDYQRFPQGSTLKGSFIKGQTLKGKYL